MLVLQSFVAVYVQHEISENVGWGQEVVRNGLAVVKLLHRQVVVVLFELRFDFVAVGNHEFLESSLREHLKHGDLRGAHTHCSNVPQHGVVRVPFEQLLEVAEEASWQHPTL